MTDVKTFQLGGIVVANPYPDVKVNQAGVYALGSQPADFIYSTQFADQILGAAETASGLYNVYAHEFGVYALVRPHGDRRELRAWTFKQDDHEFYGIQLSGEITAIHDKLTGGWFQWRSPGETIWRVEDVIDWESFNIAADTSTGILWEIDPTGRLDQGVTPITSIVYGGYTKRMRTEDQCYSAELALSEGQPPSGIDAGDIGITLQTSDDGGLTYLNHGEVPSEVLGQSITVRWYGLGLMNHPSRIFKITDTGYARRIDGLDIETNDGG